MAYWLIACRSHRRHQTDEVEFHLVSMFLVNMMDDLELVSMYLVNTMDNLEILYQKKH